MLQWSGRLAAHLRTALLPILVAVFVALLFGHYRDEHPLRVSKSASALIGAGMLWTIYAFGLGDVHALTEQLGESVTVTARIVFFLMGAMTIVEVVDAHNGFEVITSRIRTTSLSSLMWLIGFVTFVLSAILDNLTTTIVMVSLMRKLLDRREDRLLLRRHHRHRRQRRRRLVADRRRHHDDAVDRRPDHDRGHHQGACACRRWSACWCR